MSEFDLAEVIAERALTFQADAGWLREVRVSIGRPISGLSDENGPCLCPYQVAGLNRDRVIAIFGLDAMQALLLAIHTIPAELAAFMRKLGGRFLYADALETGFVRSRRNTVDLVDAVFTEDDDAALSRVRAPVEQFFLNVDLDIAAEGHRLTKLAFRVEEAERARRVRFGWRLTIAPQAAKLPKLSSQRARFWGKQVTARRMTVKREAKFGSRAWLATVGFSALALCSACLTPATSNSRKTGPPTARSRSASSTNSTARPDAVREDVQAARDIEELVGLLEGKQFKQAIRQAQRYQRKYCFRPLPEFLSSRTLRARRVSQCPRSPEELTVL
jgi:hypothetical protein